MEKGQMFSLDFLVSLIAITAAVGLLIQTVEVNTYYQKEDRTSRELKAVSETAARLLLASNETTCVNPVTEPPEHLMNCVREDIEADTITNLFPQNFEFELTGIDPSLSSGELQEEDFYQIDRIFAVGTGAGVIAGRNPVAIMLAIDKSNSMIGHHDVPKCIVPGPGGSCSEPGNCPPGECKKVTIDIEDGTCLDGSGNAVACDIGSSGNCLGERTGWVRLAEFEVTQNLLDTWYEDPDDRDGGNSDRFDIETAYNLDSHYDVGDPEMCSGLNRPRLRAIKINNSGEDPAEVQGDTCDSENRCYEARSNYTYRISIVGEELASAGDGYWAVYGWADTSLRIPFLNTSVRRQAITIPGSEDFALQAGQGEDCDYRRFQETVYEVGEVFSASDPAGLEVRAFTIGANWTGYDPDLAKCNAGGILTVEKVTDGSKFCGGLNSCDPTCRAASCHCSSSSADIWGCNNPALGEFFQLKMWSDHQEITITDAWYRTYSVATDLGVDTVIGGGLCDGVACDRTFSTCGNRDNYQTLASVDIGLDSVESMEGFFAYIGFESTCEESGSYQFAGFRFLSPSLDSYVARQYPEYSDGTGSDGGGSMSIYPNDTFLENGIWNMQGWSDELTNYKVYLNVARMSSARTGGVSFVESPGWEAEDEIGVVSFSVDALEELELTPASETAEISSVIEAITADTEGGTAIANAITTAADGLLAQEDSESYDKFIILLTDGQANICTSAAPYNLCSDRSACCDDQATADAKTAAEDARLGEITIYVIGFADSSLIGTYQAHLEEIAKDMDTAYCTAEDLYCGKYYYAEDEQQLNEIYELIALDIEQRSGNIVIVSAEAEISLRVWGS